MNTTVTKQDLLDYRARWQMVADFEREELRSMTVNRKFRKLAALFGFGRSLSSAESIEDVRKSWESWAELKLKYHERISADIT